MPDNYKTINSLQKGDGYVSALVNLYVNIKFYELRKIEILLNKIPLMWFKKLISDNCISSFLGLVNVL